jgi:hypothetical protein
MQASLNVFVDSFGADHSGPRRLPDRDAGSVHHWFEDCVLPDHARLKRSFLQDRARTTCFQSFVGLKLCLSHGIVVSRVIFDIEEGYHSVAPYVTPLSRCLDDRLSKSNLGNRYNLLLIKDDKIFLPLNKLRRQVIFFP